MLCHDQSIREDREAAEVERELQGLASMAQQLNTVALQQSEGLDQIDDNLENATEKTLKGLHENAEAERTRAGQYSAGGFGIGAIVGGVTGTLGGAAGVVVGAVAGSAVGKFIGGGIANLAKKNVDREESNFEKRNGELLARREGRSQGAYTASCAPSMEDADDFLLVDRAPSGQWGHPKHEKKKEMTEGERRMLRAAREAEARTSEGSIILAQQGEVIGGYSDQLELQSEALHATTRIAGASSFTGTIRNIFRFGPSPGEAKTCLSEEDVNAEDVGPLVEELSDNNEDDAISELRGIVHNIKAQSTAQSRELDKHNRLLDATYENTTSNQDKLKAQVRRINRDL